MRSAVIPAQPNRKAHARNQRITLLQTLMPNQRPHAVLNRLGDVDQGHARPDCLLCILPDLTMHLGRLSVVLQKVRVEVIEVALLLVGGAVAVVVGVLDLLADGEGLACEEKLDRNGGRFCLRGWVLLLLARFSLLLLFGGPDSCAISALGLGF